MNRLWVRLSLMISAVLFLVFFLQFLEIMRPDEHPEGPDEPPKAEIARRLVDFMGLSLVVGLAGGLVIGRVVSAPLEAFSQAAHRIGQGELDVRVAARGSQEITDLAQTFNRMAADLQRAETQRNNLMADISHELRTPLSVLEGNLRAALDRVYALDEAEIANLYSQTRHLIRLVNDLRELSLAEAGQLALGKEPTDLNALIQEALQALEPLANEKGVQLLDQASRLPEISADGTRIRQVLFNLLSNALRYTHQGDKIVIRSTASETDVQISIQDSGEGLEPEQLPLIFNRFHRADPSRSRETGGTGLGLAIVKAIVEAHGGRVKAASDGKGRGSTFSFSLPCGSA
jgi:two-component system OmpR family sensor kinase/two-component system sensor histidine kinase BaeS